ncbi:MAG: hypothetical protein WC313_04105 [Candidatus Kapaibacterium sp.]
MFFKRATIIFLVLLLAFNFEAFSNVDFSHLRNLKLTNNNSISGSILNLEKFISARRGGGSFRGMRRSNSRSRSRTSARTAPRTNPQKTPSFGGKRMTSKQASAKYGTPRRVESMSGKNAAGAPMNYNIHHYGGFSNSLMTGYMLGNMAWWMMVPSMLYSRPVYVEKEDGSVDVYPPAFDWGRLFLFIAVFAVIIMGIRSYRRTKRELNSSYSQSSFV